jgi:hypothetical protein
MVIARGIHRKETERVMFLLGIILGAPSARASTFGPGSHGARNERLK